MAARTLPSSIASVAMAVAIELGAGVACGQPARPIEPAPWQTPAPTDPLFPIGASFTVMGASTVVAGAAVLFVDSRDAERVAAHGSIGGGAALMFVGGLAWASATSGSVSDPRLWDAPRQRTAGVLLTGVGAAAVGASAGMIVTSAVDETVDGDAVEWRILPGIVGLGMTMTGVILWPTSEEPNTWADVARERDPKRRREDDDPRVKKARQDARRMRNAGIGLVVAGFVVGQVAATFGVLAALGRDDAETVIAVSTTAVSGVCLATGIALTAVGAKRAGVEAAPTVNVELGPGGGRLHGSF